MLSILLDIIYLILFLLLLPLILYRVIREKRYRTGWGERFGFVPRRSGDRRCVWIHAVSMGEINAIATIVRELRGQLPDVDIAISTTTDTGMNRARKLYGGAYKVFFFPLDFSFAVRESLRRIRPACCILMELEVWPNFTRLAHRREIPLIVANGRISSGKGFPRYKRVAPLIRPIFRRLSLVLTQDRTYADRFAFLGVPDEKIQVVGSLKYDTAEITDQVAGSGDLAEQLRLDPQAPILVAGSTGPGEEEIILNACNELRNESSLFGLRLVIVPRKPERFDEVADLIATGGRKVIRYSLIKNHDHEVAPDADDAVILGDTLGDLRKFYSLASVIFVGRSLIPMGGSDMMEAAALAKPVIVGPYTDNFTETVRKLMNAQAIEIVADGRQFIRIASKLMHDKELAQAMSRRARQVIRDNQGATRKTVAHILSCLKAGPG